VSIHRSSSCERYLVDTDVLSEPQKPRPHQAVLDWLREHEAELYTSAIVIGEIAWGIERLANGKKRHDHVKDYKHAALDLVNPFD
jgi:predicted nucleic acid-binding protein